ncbi:hypothetical protein [Asaia krungthepensis]|uniref:Uncharacterized protein n=1 Tax=Asaia krungthepensis NRIC 0535 TaxID=1307925 RepID=A0ABQ0Q2K6_9PROT|nr:hypothetical protein [Asaia krungthepensis]GBQ88331.1 hypothetical protein AA0535_1517 [Asaia krungthepensis NRIC 0535]
MTKLAPAIMDCSPTPERLRRGRFKKAGEALVVWSTVAWLYEAGDVGDDEVAAARRWRAEYDYAELGTIETNDRGRQVEKGDLHTWMLGRGKCAQRLRVLREILGPSLYSRIDMMLVREMSFPDIARMVFPEGTRAQARTKAAAQCALALERLAECYKNKKLASYDLL